MPYMDVGARKSLKIKQNFRYDKHSLQRYFYEPKEIIMETQDERKFKGIKYTEILDKLANGTIKVENLGINL